MSPYFTCIFLYLSSGDDIKETLTHIKICVAATLCVFIIAAIITESPPNSPKLCRHLD